MSVVLFILAFYYYQKLATKGMQTGRRVGGVLRRDGLEEVTHIDLDDESQS